MLHIQAAAAGCCSAVRRSTDRSKGMPCAAKMSGVAFRPASVSRMTTCEVMTKFVTMVAYSRAATALNTVYVALIKSHVESEHQNILEG